MLRGAIENVVRNAVRHTADGTQVEISIERRDPDRRAAARSFRCAITVREFRTSVAEPVRSLSIAGHWQTNSQNGTGLGLAITRRVFEVHGGTATAANADGGGFVVSLELPLHDAGRRRQPQADTRPTTEEHGNAITAA